MDQDAGEKKVMTKKVGGHVMKFKGKSFEAGMDKLTSYQVCIAANHRL
jgi:hypothetical protein